MAKKIMEGNYLLLRLPGVRRVPFESGDRPLPHGSNSRKSVSPTPEGSKYLTLKQARSTKVNLVKTRVWSTDRSGRGQEPIRLQRILRNQSEVSVKLRERRGRPSKVCGHVSGPERVKSVFTLKNYCKFFRRPCA